jgi:hypothetical protein
MGMFDHITVECPLPKTKVDIPVPNDLVYQTKSLECQLEKYKIDDRTLLWHMKCEYKTVPEDERPYKDSDNPLMQFAGSMQVIELGWERYNFTGFINFYTEHKGRWLEFAAKVVDGQCQEMMCVEDYFHSPVDIAKWKCREV